MIELFVGWGVSALMGSGTLYLIFMVFALAFPRLFRVGYWLFMMPIMSLGPAILGWLCLGFWLGWNSATFMLTLACGTAFGFAFCLWSDPKQTP